MKVMAHLHRTRNKVNVNKTSALHAFQKSTTTKKNHTTTICSLLFDDYIDPSRVMYLSLGLLVQREGLKAGK